MELPGILVGGSRINRISHAETSDQALVDITLAASRLAIPQVPLQGLTAGQVESIPLE